MLRNRRLHRSSWWEPIAERATELEKQIAAATDDQAAVSLAEELLALRTRVQGKDHWETINARWSLDLRRKLAAVSAETREGWRQGENAVRSAAELEAQGRLPEALPLRERRVKDCEGVLGIDHPYTAISYNNLASNLKAQARYAEAQPLFVQALAILRKQFGEDHPDTARGYNSLAGNLYAQARYAEAQSLYERALAIKRKRLGEDHPDTALGYNNLAMNLQRQAKYAEAQPLLEQALAIKRKLFAEDHADTAVGYNNLASNLYSQAKYAEAQPLLEQALSILRKRFGEDHPDTARGYNNLAGNLYAQARYAEAQSLYEQALAINRKHLGEDHPLIATGANNLALNLQAQAKYAEAQPLLEQALSIRRKRLGEDHPDTASGYNNLALNLQAQFRYAEAQPLFEQAVAIWRKRLGEDHPETATGYNNLGLNLQLQAKYAEAQPLYERSIVIKRRRLGEDHPDTAQCYNSLALNLNAQMRYAEAQPLFEQAVAIWRKRLGEDHPGTAAGCNNLALNLNSQAKYAEAQPLFEQALTITRKRLGEDHPDAAQCYGNLAGNLNAQAKYAEAHPIFEQALAIVRKLFGEDHPGTAESYSNLAFNLLAQARNNDAQVALQRAVPAYEASRLVRATGLERSLDSSANPRRLLAVLQAPRDPQTAWRNAELTHARGLLDQLATADDQLLTPMERSERDECRTELARLQPQILTLTGKGTRSEEDNQRLEALLTQLRAASSRLAALAVQLSERQVADSTEIQAAIPADAALVFWIDEADRAGHVQEHWGCVVRRTGEPHWERLSGTGEEGAWTTADSERPRRLRSALSSAATAADIDALAQTLRVQRLEPLRKHLEGVKTLYIVGVEAMAGVPVDVLAPEYTISYVSSGTFLARLQQRARPQSQGLLALGDPVFRRSDGKPAPSADDLPPGGLLVLQVAAGGAAAKAQLEPGDVLVRYGETELHSMKELAAAIEAQAQADQVRLTVWREGAPELVVRDAPPGKLGITLHQEPARDAIAKRRQTDAMLLATRGGSWQDLPGTRVELAQLQKLLGTEAATVLLESNASEQSLERLRHQGALFRFRYLHFATHGEANPVRAFESALILAQRRNSRNAAPQGGATLPEWPTGGERGSGILEARCGPRDAVRLRDGTRTTGRRRRLPGVCPGVPGGGEPRGLPQPVAGGRYGHLPAHDPVLPEPPGETPGLEAPLPKAAALAEAKTWLRNLSADEVRALTADRSAVQDEPGKGEPLPPTRPSAAPDSKPKPGEQPRDVRGADRRVRRHDASAARPFSHPRYWSAFVLIGDPN